MALSAQRRQSLAQAAQTAPIFRLAYIGLVNGLLDALSDAGSVDASTLAGATQSDEAYVHKWLEAAFAFELLDAQDDLYSLSELGAAFLPSTEQTLMPMAVGSILGAHMAERAAGLVASGEQPGESVLAERETVLPWFGPMLETLFAPFFEEVILPSIPAFEAVNASGGVAVDLGCGNGWYLRALARRCPQLKGIGLDGFQANVDQAGALAHEEGLQDQLDFRCGDIFEFSVDEQVDLIAMNRALHHVWHDKDRVFDALRSHLKPGGWAVIWEPNFPTDRDALRTPARRGLAMQNLAEHVQGNHLLNPSEIEAAFAAHRMNATTYLFRDGLEAVIVAQKT